MHDCSNATTSVLVQSLDKAIAAVRPGMRFREIGDIISQHVGQHKYQVWGLHT